MAGCNIVLAYYTTKHKEVIGAPYMPMWGKDLKLLKMIVAVYGVEYTHKLIDAFFDYGLTDDWIKDRGFTIGIFHSQINKLLIVVRNKKIEEKDEEVGTL